MTARTYQLAPLDRTGVLLGLSGFQTAAAGVAVAAFAVLAARVSVVAGLLGAAPPAACTVRLAGHTIVDVLPLARRWVRLTFLGRVRWFASLGQGTAEWPPAVASQTVLAVDGAAHGFDGRLAPIAVVHDQQTGRLAVSVRVEGAAFALSGAEEQDRLLRSWGDCLEPFTRPGSAVIGVRWSEWTAPAGLDAQRAWIDQRAATAVPDRLAEYHDLLDREAGATWSHETLVTLMGTGPIGRRSRRSQRSLDDSATVLLDEARLFAQRLDQAGLLVTGPLSPAQLSLAVRCRLDPASRRQLLGCQRSLGECVGVVALTEPPLAAELDWRHWQVDDSVHRSFYVTDWPRQPLGAAWLQGLALETGVVRTVAVFCEPVAPSASRRSVDRQVTKLVTDADQRIRAGFRVGGIHGRAEQAVLDREQELVAGFAEFGYVGIIDVCAATAAALDRAAAELVQLAAAAGIDLRALHGRHDAAVTATLPLAIAPAAKGLLA